MMLIGEEIHQFRAKPTEKLSGLTEREAIVCDGHSLDPAALNLLLAE